MNPVVWIDLETTGLDPKKDKILEVGLVATNDRFQRIEGIPDFQAIVKPMNGLDVMKLDPAVVEMHSKNRLLAEIAAGKGRSKIAVGEDIGEWLTTARNVYYNGLSQSDITRQNLSHYQDVRFLMAGSSVGQFDRQFFAYWLREYMPMFDYRVLDVSSVKETIRRVFGDEAVYNALDASEDQVQYKAHRVLPDIEASIAELRHYISVRFNNPYQEVSQ